MASSNTTKIQFKLLLDNGTDGQGNVKTVSVSLGDLSVSGYNLDKAVAIATALEECLTKSVYSLSEVRTNKVNL